MSKWDSRSKDARPSTVAFSLRSSQSAIGFLSTATYVRSSRKRHTRPAASSCSLTERFGMGNFFFIHVTVFPKNFKGLGFRNVNFTFKATVRSIQGTHVRPSFVGNDFYCRSSGPQPAGGSRLSRSQPAPQPL